jgi:hypothetical protein
MQKGTATRLSLAGWNNYTFVVCVKMIGRRSNRAIDRIPLRFHRAICVKFNHVEQYIFDSFEDLFSVLSNTLALITIQKTTLF